MKSNSNQIWKEITIFSVFFFAVLFLISLMFPHNLATSGSPDPLNISKGDLLFYKKGFSQGDLVIFNIIHNDAVEVVYINNTPSETNYINTTNVDHFGIVEEYSKETGSVKVYSLIYNEWQTGFDKLPTDIKESDVRGRVVLKANPATFYSLLLIASLLIYTPIKRKIFKKRSRN